MCFSASASLAAGTLLLGLGTVTMKAARRPGEWPFAAVPLLFAIQQFIEGTIWLSFSHDAARLQAVMTYAYTAFSHVLWPVFIPLAVLLIEPAGWRRRALGGFAAAGAVVSAGLLYTMAEYGIVSRPSGHHIEYLMPHFFALGTMALYLLSTSASQLISTHGTVKAFGVLALLSFGVAYVAYTSWFISVWCYLAAVLSAIVLLHFKAIPVQLAKAQA
ncbi:MAG TPA: DUF6629 family protein [Rhizobacter sp.]|nr:DUF6629 family protein [Rhizobacter sp.]